MIIVASLKIISFNVIADATMHLDYNFGQFLFQDHWLTHAKKTCTNLIDIP